MENILTYIIVFGLILAGVFVWQVRYAKVRPFWLSFQIYPNLKLWILIEKKDGKHENLIIKTEYALSTEINKIEVELINSKREILLINLQDDLISNNFSSTKGNTTSTYLLEFNSFKNKLKKSNSNFKSFRFKLTDLKKNTYKSHELAFNKNWTIYKPDSGKYN